MKNSLEYINDIKIVIDNIPDVEKLKGCSILVTGATGLIGSAVADILLVLNKECGILPEERSRALLSASLIMKRAGTTFS